MTQFVNNIDTAALKETINTITARPEEGKMSFQVHTTWGGQFRSESKTGNIILGDKVIERDFLIQADEPEELLGKNSGANPQELLMAALNACMTVGYVSGAAMRGITLSKLEIITKGELDLSGFFGINPTVKPGYDTLHYDVNIAGNGTPEQFEEIHKDVMRLSPNRFNVAMPVQLEANLNIL